MLQKNIQLGVSSRVEADDTSFLPWEHRDRNGYQLFLFPTHLVTEERWDTVSRSACALDETGSRLFFGNLSAIPKQRDPSKENSEITFFHDWPWTKSIGFIYDKTLKRLCGYAMPDKGIYNPLYTISASFMWKINCSIFLNKKGFGCELVKFNCKSDFIFTKGIPHPISEPLTIYTASLSFFISSIIWYPIHETFQCITVCKLDAFSQTNFNELHDTPQKLTQALVHLC